jgi:hypothetical protein
MLYDCPLYTSLRPGFTLLAEHPTLSALFQGDQGHQGRLAVALTPFYNMRSTYLST